MKDLNRGKQSISSEAESAYSKGKLLQELDDYKKDKERLEDEKDDLIEQVEQEQAEKLSFQERLEQAMRDLEISQDEQEQAIAIRDKAIASRNFVNGRLGGLTASNNRLREQVETLVIKNESLRNSNKIAVEQVVAANKQREAFQTAYERVKAAYKQLKTKQQQQQLQTEKLQANFERLKTGCRKLKTEHEVLKANYQRDMTEIAAVYQTMSLTERSQLPLELKRLLDRIEETHQG